MNLPKIPNHMFAPKNIRQPIIPIKSVRIITLRLPIILSIQLEQRAEIPAERGHIEVKND